MEKIEGLDPAQFVSEVATSLVEERKRQAANIIKQQLQRIETLSGELKQAQKQVTKCTEKIAAAQAKIDKFKSGDWSVLVAETEPKTIKDSNNVD
jgi:cell division septum initiation protein DivIVA